MSWDGFKTDANGVLELELLPARYPYYIDDVECTIETEPLSFPDPDDYGHPDADWIDEDRNVVTIRVEGHTGSNTKGTVGFRRRVLTGRVY